MKFPAHERIRKAAQTHRTRRPHYSPALRDVEDGRDKPDDARTAGIIRRLQPSRREGIECPARGRIVFFLEVYGKEPGDCSIQRLDDERRIPGDRDCKRDEPVASDPGLEIK